MSSNKSSLSEKDINSPSESMNPSGDSHHPRPLAQSSGGVLHSPTVTVARSSNPTRISRMTNAGTSSNLGYSSDKSIDFCEVDPGPKRQSTIKTSNDWIKKATKQEKEDARVKTSKLLEKGVYRSPKTCPKLKPGDFVASLKAGSLVKINKSIPAKKRGP